MKYLDLSGLKKLSRDTFKNTGPFPWVNPHGCISRSGFKELLETMPDVSIFEKSFNVDRSYGQKPHDRFELKYIPELKLSTAWQEFIDELYGTEYRNEIRRLFGTRNFSIRFQWQYSLVGCSVSPHCDSGSKAGSHIFYFNTPSDWKEEWGGQTLVLDDEGKLDCNSAPDLSMFGRKISTQTLGNYSLLFARTDHSWHMVGELRSPPNVLRKIFTVVIERKPSFSERLTRKLSTLIGLGS